MEERTEEVRVTPFWYVKITRKSQQMFGGFTSHITLAISPIVREYATTKTKGGYFK